MKQRGGREMAEVGVSCFGGVGGDLSGEHHLSQDLNNKKVHPKTWERVFWQKYGRLRMDMKRLEAAGFVKTLLKNKGWKWNRD